MYESDIEINLALARAIGWSDNRKSGLGQPDPDVIVWTRVGELPEVAVWFDRDWKKFDFMDPTVIWPIATKYEIYPQRFGARYWTASSGNQVYFHGTPGGAVALAVINSQ